MLVETLSHSPLIIYLCLCRHPSHARLSYDTNIRMTNRFTSIASQPDNQIDASQCYPSPAASTIMATSLAGDHCHLGFDASQTPAGSNYPSTNYTYDSGLPHAHALSSHDAFAADYPPLSEYEPHGPAGVVDLKLEASHADDHAQFYGSWGGSEFTSAVSEAPAFPFGPYMDSVGAAGAPPYTYTLEHVRERRPSRLFVLHESTRLISERFLERAEGSTGPELDDVTG